MKKFLLLLAMATVFGTAFCQQIPKYKITDIESLINTNSGQVLVLNFWATFCKPCVAEIPSFISVCDNFKKNNVKLMLISVDLPSYYPKKVASFAKKHQFNTNLAWLDETNADYFCPKIDSTWSGSIPATLIINTVSGKRKFVEGEITGEELESEIKKVI